MTNKNVFQKTVVLSNSYIVFMILFLSILSISCINGEKKSKTLIVSDTLPWSERMALSQMHRDGDSLSYNEATKSRWIYDKGTYLKGIEAVWRNTGNQKYFDYIRNTISSFITPEGTIRTYNIEEYNIDMVNSGKLLLTIYQDTKEENIKNAALLLMRQLENHPRTKEGGFWHKKRYPWQMWLDGLYMGGPFYAEFSQIFNQPENFDDVANQFIYMESHTRDTKTGLLYHAWDESKEQKWANKETGCSPHFWNRSMGWYAMAIVDVLDYLPENHPKREPIISIFKNMTDALLSVQDSTLGVWYQVLDQGNREGNYFEASGSSMIVYAMAKAIRKGYLDNSYYAKTKKGYDGLIKTFIVVDSDGLVTLTNNCQGAGLGGDPYRDGSFEYYISEPIVNNDLKGVGPFIMASVEMERLTEQISR
ncbi:MAG: glycoside hydrolase family 105 protein [Tenuifilaceae bacterium]